jgi:CO/xanthine dehydrogenase FAD-binding subunit
MIPAKFDYVRPASLAEAVSALADGGEDAKIIAGGQSLLPLLRLRMAYPELLVDVGGLGELRGVTDAGDALLIWSTTRWWPSTAGCSRRPPARSPTPPSATAARSAGPWRTPTRPVTCPPWRWPSMSR